MAISLVEPIRPLLVERPDEMWEFRGQSFEEHLDCWQILDEQVQKDKWKLSSIAASLDTKYKDKTVDRFAHETRRSARRIREYAQTYRAFENGGRSPILSFTHHSIAASYADPVKAIQKAEDGEWSKRELEKWVRTGIEPAQEPEEPQTFTKAMQALHDKAIRDELGEKITAVRAWLETPADPLLSTVYLKLIKTLEWQRDRTLESDCAAIMKLFSGDVGTEAPERASDADIAKWLHDHGFIMSRVELGDAGNPDPDPSKRIEPSGRIGLMLKLKILVVKSRDESRQEGRKGSIPAVYAAERDYLIRLDKIAADAAAFRGKALHKLWMERLERYAPELLPKTKAA